MFPQDSSAFMIAKKVHFCPFPVSPGCMLDFGRHFRLGFFVVVGPIPAGGSFVVGVGGSGANGPF